MNIYVTQGHEKGIGLEVFFNSCLLLEKKLLSKIIFIGFKKSVNQTLVALRLPFYIDNEFIHVGGLSIRTKWLTNRDISESFSTLSYALNELENNKGILFTLPTSKDQFPVGINGHTEFFRHHFQKNNIGMFFSSPEKNILLITDHVRLSDVPNIITENLIYNRTLEAVLCLKKWGINFNNIYISGINPHSGENGLMGNEDSQIEAAIKKLSSKLKLPIHGPFSGDSLFNLTQSYQDLLVYMFHDQGLGAFKATQGIIGSNISLGLPFPRFSPDHGTSFKQYGKNVADFRGCSYALKEALNLLNRLENG